MIASDALAGGFADPVFDAQRVFRGTLDALSRPGRIIDIGTPAEAPPPLMPGAAAILATLADDGTSAWLDAPFARTLAGAWIAFHTGAAVITEPGAAVFAVIADAGAMPDLAVFAAGSDAYPDRSATLLLQLDAFDGGPPLAFSGPGIRGTVTVAPRGLPADFAERMRFNRARFPRGVDLFLVSGSRIIGLPRTTIVAEAG